MPNETAVDGVWYVALVTDGVQVDCVKSICVIIPVLVNRYIKLLGNILTNWAFSDKR